MGIDCGKNINVREMTILVDSLGLSWSIKVTAANISDNQAVILLSIYWLVKSQD